ncbi:MAG: TolC family protein [Terriglobia bacterium]|jgi:cobalt-zinc-cadmium efflux system outer membrane protein|nr:TolC family protein [Terriglobia bacterium]
MTLNVLPNVGRFLWISVFFMVLGVSTVVSAQEQVAVPAKLTLTDALQLAMKNNPILQRDRQNLAIANASVRQAKLLPNPELDVSSQSYPLFESKPGSFWNNQEFTLLAGQTIETASKRSKRTRVAQQEFLATGSDVLNAEREIRLEVKGRYFAAVLAKTQLSLAQEILKQFDEVIRLNEARFKQGELSGLEMNRIRAERLRFYSDVLDSNLQLANSKTALLEVLGAGDLTGKFDIVETLAAAVQPVQLSELQQLALQSRPDLVAAQQRLERNRREVEVQKADAMPNVTPSFGYKRDFGVNTAAFGITLPIPLFNRNQGGITKASAQLEQQRYEVTRSLLAVRREVQQGYQTLESQAERLRALEKEYVPAAKKAHEIAQESYRLGALDLIGLLDAERVYRETLRAYNVALFDYKIAVFQLEASVGKEF